MKKIWQIPTKLDETETLKEVCKVLEFYADALTTESDNKIIGIVEKNIDFEDLLLSIHFNIKVLIDGHSHVETLLYLNNCVEYPFKILYKNTKIHNKSELEEFMGSYSKSEEVVDIFSKYIYLINK